MSYQFLLIYVIPSALIFNFLFAIYLLKSPDDMSEFLTDMVLLIAFPLYSLTWSSVLWVTYKLLV